MSACRAPRTMMSPRVASAAQAQLAASSRSGIGRWVKPRSRGTPSISITRSVCTLMIAPIFCSAQIRSMISGSTAALRSSVTPSARTAVEQHLLGRADARVGQLELRAVQPVRRGQVQALGRLVDHGAELAQRLEVEVDRPVADVAAAEIGDERVAEPVQQRPAQQDRDPAGTGVHVDLVDAGALHVGRVEDHLAVAGRR